MSPEVIRLRHSELERTRNRLVTCRRSSQFSPRARTPVPASLRLPAWALFVLLRATFEHRNVNSRADLTRSQLELELLVRMCACRIGPRPGRGLLCAPRRRLGPTAAVRSYGVGGRVCRRQLPCRPRRVARRLPRARQLTDPKARSHWAATREDSPALNGAAGAGLHIPAPIADPS
jgi:hypothetical protein